MEHVPSGQFCANGAWLCCAVLAHNLLRWSVTLGRRSPIDELVVSRTVRTRLIAIPARLVNRAGTPAMRGPLHWPGAGWFTARLAACAPCPTPAEHHVAAGAPQTLTQR